MVQASIDERSAPISTTTPVTPVVRASERLWDIVWPAWTHAGIECTVGSFAEALPFVVEHYPSIFATEPGRFLEEKTSPAKQRFLADCDAFLMRDGDRVIGISIGHPSDWSTYYCRTVAVLPAYRDRGLFLELLRQLEAPLRAAGVERIEGDTSPGNLPMNRALLSLDWLVTGHLTSERWATVLRYTKHLTPATAQCFHRQFLNVPPRAVRAEQDSSRVTTKE